MSQLAKQVYEFGPFRVDPLKRRLLRGGDVVPLTPKAFDILLALLARQGEVLSKEELMQAIWPDVAVEENNLTRNISSLRKALGEEPDKHQYVVTIPGRGYSFVAEVKESAKDGTDRTTADEVGVAAEARQAEVVSTDEASAAQNAASAKLILGELKRHKLGVVLTLAIIALAVAVWWIYSNRKSALTEKDKILLTDFANTTGDAVFDGTLKEALAVHLGQSPFLNIYSAEQVREALQYMNRSPDERVSRTVAREICQREGLKALLAGSIATFGRNYAIMLEAVNAQTGEVIARELGEAESKEQVLKALGRAAVQLREKLGESLSSIRKFDVPIEQATTTSLEALKAFSLAMELRRQGKLFEGIPHFHRAIELDPNFASAYAWLGANYRDSSQPEKAVEYVKKAFELRERVSEREKLFITLDYYYTVTGEWDKQLEILELRKGGGPRIGSLAARYIIVGQYEKAAEEAREDIRLNPHSIPATANLAHALIHLNRFAEAEESLERAQQEGLDTPIFHNELYALAFLLGDTPGMKRQIDWATGRKDEYLAFQWQAMAAAFAGQLRRAREYSRIALDLAERANLKEIASGQALSQALAEAAVGHCPQARADTTRALAMARSHSYLATGARVLALCGETGQAQKLADELVAQYPKDTQINAFELPLIRAAIELHQRNPDRAIELLQPTGSYGRGRSTIHHGFSRYWPVYLRGQAYLLKRAGPEAAAEFQKMLDHRGWDPTSHLYPLAHLGLARAAALVGDTAQSRKHYEDLFALWKEADADLPVLIEAKKEYDRLK